MRRRLVGAILACLSLAGCTIHGDLAYVPSPAARGVIAPRPLVSGIVAYDERKEAPNRLATVMGGYGNPLSIVDTSVPVKDEVARVVSMALILRNDLSRDGSGPYLLRLDVRKFDSDHYFRSQARIDLGLQLIDRASGRMVYADAAADRIVDFQLFGTGGRDLQTLAQTVLNRTVDRLLDAPGFQAFMMGAGR